MSLKDAQEFLRQKGIDGWLVFDFHGSNPVLKRVLGGDRHLTRRVYYWIPAEGNPTLVASAIDRGQFHDVSGLRTYTHRASMLDALSDVLRGAIVSYASEVKFDLLDVPEGPVVSEAAAGAPDWSAAMAGTGDD